jgi:hypothetical protein
MGKMENGVVTDVAGSNRKIAELLSEYLRNWKSAHPRAAVTLEDQAAPDSMVKQLRAIGYAE